MKENHEELKTAETLIETNTPKGMKHGSSEDGFRRKVKAAGRVMKQKTRLIARDLTRVPGVNRDETFPPSLQASSVVLLIIELREKVDLHYSVC